MPSYLIVLNKDKDTVSFVDTQTRSIVKAVWLDKNPHKVALTPSYKKAFVSNAGANTISVFDMAR